MPLLKPPAPEIPKRKYYIRIEEPLAARMEKYAEFLGARTIDHVIGQALEFVFRKDTEFAAWLADHTETTPSTEPKSVRRKPKPNGTGAAVDAPGTDHATAGSTI
jgi:hypothetical protein